jgi:hypothetical protein
MQNEHQDATGSFIPTWQKALGDETAFGKLLSPHVTLQGSIFAEPINGRERRGRPFMLLAVSPIRLRFTHESTTTDRCYLEWELEALGQRLDGVSVIGFDGSGLVDFVALHHRPLAGLLAFSAEMGRELGNSVGPDMFYPAPTGS